MKRKSHRVCPNCGFESPSPVECAKCGIYFEKYKLNSPKSSVDIISSELALRKTDRNQYLYNSKVNIWALPIAVIFCWVANLIWPLRIVGQFSSTIPLHELGHAVMAWMGGVLAIPLGFFVPTAGLTVHAENRNILVSLLFIGSLSWVAYRAWLEKLLFLSTLAAIIISTSLYFTFIASLNDLRIWITFSGCAGEFILGTILILAFYNPLFSFLRWDFFRYPFLLMGTYAYFNAFTMWSRISKKLQPLPYGTAISANGAQDTNGDMNRLIAGGWTEADIVSNYLTIGKICLFLIVMQYMYSLMRSRPKVTPPFA